MNPEHVALAFILGTFAGAMVANLYNRVTFNFLKDNSDYWFQQWRKCDESYTKFLLKSVKAEEEGSD